tara:strand:- start:29 stop:223 length:195 start_codon:yes stop_codon:yes gene_type:complete
VGFFLLEKRGSYTFSFIRLITFNVFASETSTRTSLMNGVNEAIVKRLPPLFLTHKTFAYQFLEK